MLDSITSVSIKVDASAIEATNSIERLAIALGKLKESSKLTTTVNNLTKLKTALDGLKNVSPGLQNVERIGTSFSKLQGIGKLTGLTSAVNALKKIPDVMAAMNNAALDEFTLKMNKLAAALAPLSTRLNEVGTAFNRLPTKIQKIVTGTNKLASATQKAAATQHKHGEALNATSFNISSVIFNIQSYVAALQTVITQIKEFMSLAIEWDGIQARFGRAFGESAQESLAWIEKLSEGLLINKQEFMQNSSLFAEMLKGFGINERDAGKMAIGYTELAYDIWAAYNDVYKSLGGEEGAIAAVRSAIAGEVEPIRRAGFTIVDSQLAITAANHGLAYSTQKSSEAQKSYLRYLTLVDQAMDKNIIGVYAAEMKTAEGVVRTLSQQFKLFSQTLGQLFLPILTTVVPYLIAFVQILTDAVEVIAKFFGIELFKIDWSRGTSMGGLTEEAGAATDSLTDAGKAAKALKSYTMGFDELNVINPNTGSTAGAAGAGVGGGFEDLDVDSVWDESMFGNVKNQVDEIKKSILDLFDNWAVKAALATVGLVKLGTWLGKIWGVIKLIKASKLGTTLAAIFGALKGSSAAKSALTFMFPKTSVVLSTASKWITATFVPALTSAVTSAASWIGSTLVPAITSAITTALGAVASALGVSVGWAAAIVAAIIAAIVAAIWAATHWDEVKKFFTESVPKWFSGVKKAVQKWWEKFDLGKIVRKAMGNVKDWFSGVRDDIIGFFDDLKADIDAIDWAGIGYNMGQRVGKAFKNAGEWFSETWKNIKKGWNTFWTDTLPTFFKEKIPEFIDDVKEKWNTFWSEKVPAFFSGVLSFFTEEIPAFFSSLFSFFFVELPAWIGDMKQIGVEIVLGILQGIKDSWNEFWKGVGEFIDGFVQGFKDALGIASPSKVFAEIGKYIVEGLKSGISSAWENIKKWWQTNVAPKFTKAFWVAKWEEARKATVEKLTEIKSNISEKWNAIVSWFKTNVAPKLTKEYWKAKWDGIKQGVTQKLDEVRTAISSKWNAIKSWFSTNVAPKFTKLYWSNKIDGIKQGVSTKLNSVKTTITNLWSSIVSWFRSNVAPKFTLSYWKNKFNAVWNAAKDVFSVSKWKQLGKDALDGLFEGLGNIWGKAKSWGNSVLNSVKNVLGIHSPSVEFEELGDYCVDGLYNAFTCTDCITDHFTNLLSELHEKIREFGANVKDGVQQFVDEFKVSAEELFGWISDSCNASKDEVITSAEDLFNWITDSCNTILDDVLESLDELVSEIEEFCTDTIDMFKEMRDGSVDAINEIISALNDIPREITTVHTVVTRNETLKTARDNAERVGSIVGALGAAYGITTRANGGFVNTGEMFIAREAGPELVGSINGRTAVANNDQIVAAVSQGVYSAVVSAMNAANNGSSEQSINVYLDGKQITASVEKHQKERGVRFMGQQVYSY